jgi:rhodanese-related sulfurtransferase
MSHRPDFWLMTGLLAVVFAASAAPTDGPNPSAGPRSITAEELTEQIQRSQAPLILDVRSRGEYANGHIPGALNIPHDQLPDRLSEIDVAKTEEIVVHCQSGQRARIAEEALIKAGYSNVRDLDGHMNGWMNAGYPIEKP